MTNEDTAKKVLKDVVPGLGIRVHRVNSTRTGGALVPTPSAAERQKLATSTKMTEVGPKAAIKDKLGQE